MSFRRHHGTSVLVSAIEREADMDLDAGNVG
jgi:hypothetical protein